MPEAREGPSSLPDLAAWNVRLERRALLVARRQNRYGGFCEAMFALLATRGHRSAEGKRRGLDGNRLGFDMDSPTLQEPRVDFKLGFARAVGMQGTPALGRTLVPGMADLSAVGGSVVEVRGRAP